MVLRGLLFMKLIPLTQGFFAEIDDADYDRVKMFKWHIFKHIRKCRTIYYAITQIESNGKVHPLRMHELIMMPIPTGFQVDHENLNGLRNLRSNLRVVTISQNQYNRTKRIDCESKYKGVTIQKRKGNPTGKLLTYISIKGKQTFIGTFNSEIDAAIAYNKAALKYHGEFARLNIII